jgi:predicted phosphodiesterase
VLKIPASPGGSHFSLDFKATAVIQDILEGEYAGSSGGGQEMKTIIRWAVAQLLITSAMSADKLVGGPYVVNTGARSATVMWIVERGEASLGEAPDKLDRKAASLHAEKISFTALEAGKMYYYDIGQGDAGKGSFKMPPKRGDPYRFVVYGDTRTRHDVHARVVAKMLEGERPDFILHTGDLVENGADQRLWPIFFNIEHEVLRQTSFFPSLGNHERNDKQFYEFFDMSLPYYSFNWGNAHFVVMDSDVGNVADTPSAREAFWATQQKWLEEDLANNQSAAFRFVAAHHPPMTAVASRQGSNKQMTALVPLFERYHVTAALFGHDHNYQHYLKNGIHYVVTGGGGAPLYDVKVPPQDITIKTVSIENFVTVSVNGNNAKVEARAIDGSLIDSFELKGLAAH